MACVLRVHLSELTGQPWMLPDRIISEARAGLIRMEIALERYYLGVDPEIMVRDWPGSSLTWRIRPNCCTGVVTTPRWAWCSCERVSLF
jgi:hypothetical protein